MSTVLRQPPAVADARAVKRSSTVRRRLVILVLLVLMPTTCIALFAAYTIYVAQRHAMTTAGLETAKALSLVVDRELAYRAGILKTLAASPSLDNDDLQAFYAQARMVTPNADTSIILSDPDGQQILNTRVPLGDPTLPKLKLFESPAVPARDSRALVSNLYLSPLAGQFSFAVGVPIERQGQVRYHLSMASPAARLQQIFVQQPLPGGWVGTLLDAKGVIVARNLNAETLVGRSASDNMKALISAAASGIHQTTTLDGTPVYTTFIREPDFGWTVIISISRADLRAAALNALAAMLAAWALLSALAVWAALRVGRTIAEPVAKLQADAETMGHGGLVVEAPTGLIETDVVQRRMALASRDLRAAEEDLQLKVREAVAESERMQRAALSAQKLEALGRLTGGIAHDFNNLLQTMTTGIQLSQMLSTDERVRKALAACERAVSKAVTLTRQLMTFGSSQPGLLETVSLQHKLAGLHELLRGALRESIVVRIDVAEDTGLVQLDPVLLELAILNLALNAKDAIAGSGSVDVNAANRTLGDNDPSGLPAGDYVAVSVRDSGHGIAAALLPRIFEPFFTTKPMGKGAGLGLAQVYGFAKQMGGAAVVSSREGQGTEVTLLLPRVHGMVPVHEAAAATSEGLRCTGTVLLVEDDSLVRGLTAEALEGCGFTVLVASSADDALAIARARTDIDIVLSDIVMPGGKSGLDLQASLLELRPDLPVVLASGYSDALSADVAAVVIAKPYNVNDVARLLAQKIARR